MSAKRPPTVPPTAWSAFFPPPKSRSPIGRPHVAYPDYTERGTTTIAASLVRRGSNHLTQNTLAPSPRIVEGRPQGRCPNGCRRNSNHQGSSFFLFFTPLRWLIFLRWGPDAVSCSQTISSSSGRDITFPTALPTTTC